MLGPSGGFCEHGSYDHLARDAAELRRIVAYILDNPVKASLARTREEWQWSYSKLQL